MPLTTQRYKKSGAMIKIIIGCLTIVLLFLFSEFTFSARNEPELITQQPEISYKYLLKSMTAHSFKNRFLGSWQKKIVAWSFYNYLKSVEKRFEGASECQPICLSYEDSQTLLVLFQNLLESKTFNSLTRNKKSSLYFWMSTLNTQNDDDTDTLKYLKAAIDLNPESQPAKNFYSDLLKIKELNSQQTQQEYFSTKLGGRKMYLKYEKLYLAKAAFILSQIHHFQKDYNKELYYLYRSIGLNPYRVDPYLALSDLYLLQNEKNQAARVLKSCLYFLKEETSCKQKLSAIAV